MNMNQLLRIGMRLLMTFGVAAFVRKSRSQDKNRSQEEITQARKNEKRVQQSSRFMRRFGRF